MKRPCMSSWLSRHSNLCFVAGSNRSEATVSQRSQRALAFPPKYRNRNIVRGSTTARKPVCQRRSSVVDLSVTPCCATCVLDLCKLSAPESRNKPRDAGAKPGLLSLERGRLPIYGHTPSQSDEKTMFRVNARTTEMKIYCAQVLSWNYKTMMTIFQTDFKLGL